MTTALRGAAPSSDTPQCESVSPMTQESWNAFYQANARPLYRYLVRLTLGDLTEAEDHLQETFLRAWHWMQKHPVDPATLRPWLFTVARRIVIDVARFRRVRPTEVAVNDVALTMATTGNDIERFVEADAVRHALRQLSPDHRAALVELFYYEHTAQEAAGHLGIPEGTVKSRAHYALRALRAATLAAERRSGVPSRPRVTTSTGCRTA